MSLEGATTGDGSKTEVTNRKVTIVIEDADGGFHLSFNVEPPVDADGANVRPTAALFAGAVARRAIEEMVRAQSGGPGNEAN